MSNFIIYKFFTYNYKTILLSILPLHNKNLFLQFPIVCSSIPSYFSWTAPLISLFLLSVDLWWVKCFLRQYVFSLSYSSLPSLSSLENSSWHVYICKLYDFPFMLFEIWPAAAHCPIPKPCEYFFNISVNSILGLVTKYQFSTAIITSYQKLTCKNQQILLSYCTKLDQ